jgi:Acyl-CoA synthetase (NDP forming)
VSRGPSGLDPLFAPQSIAVIGASSDPTRIGGRPIAYMKRAGYPHSIYPVNPQRTEIQGLRSYPSIDGIDAAIDLAIVAVPETAVLDTARACARHGVKSLVVFSAGFAEAGVDGRTGQQTLASIARAAGMRVLGPNSVGLFNANVRAFPTFSVSVEQFMPAGGRTAIASQSGGYAGYVLAIASDRGLDVGALITTGNECDVEIGETVHWLAENPQIDVILVYMEGCRSSASLIEGFEAARRANKPVVAIKVGRTAVGAAAVASHTAALAGSDHLFDLLFKEYGVYRAQHTEEMFDIAYALRNGLLPRNRSLGLITVSGGIGVHMSDLATEAGLELPPLPQQAQDRIKAIVPFASTRNPLDVTGQVANEPDVLRQSLDIMLGEGDYGSAVVFLGHAGSAGSLENALNGGIKQVAQKFSDRLIACCTVSKKTPFAGTSVLAFPDPPRAIAAIRACAFFSEQRHKGHAAATKVTSPAVPIDAGRRYNEFEAKMLLRAVDITTPLEFFVPSAAHVARAARSIHGPIALKIVSADILHKSDIGGVALGLSSSAAAERAALGMLERVRRAAPQARIDGFLVSQMVSGIECIVGVHPDPVFGPVIVVGLGGTAVELLQDVSRRFAPVSEAQAHAMLRELRTFALLDGYRGQPKADVAALVRTIVSISHLAAANAERIEAFEVNPIIVGPVGAGAIAVDCVLMTRSKTP